ncbi:MAG: hypothetical protein HKN20_14650 [Gemmatimonadetes bacterium]|nr:hypothetical protein [Gemmatimonadota bacterium]
MAEDQKQGQIEEWQQYPTFQELLTDYEKFVELRQKCAKTCQALGHVIENGSPEEKDMAQNSINVYGYAIGLLEETIKARDKFLDEQA